MTVSELIELLKTCDPKAVVVVNEEPMIDDDRDAMEGAMQRVAAVETGWAEGNIATDLTFCLRPIGDILVPAIRILGINSEETDPDRKITYNGLEPMKDAQIVPIKRLPKIV